MDRAVRKAFDLDQEGVSFSAIKKGMTKSQEAFFDEYYKRKVLLLCIGIEK